MSLVRHHVESNWNLIKNIFFLGLTQMVNFASPLIVTPFLLRTIGVEKFGVVILAQTVMNFTTILTEYGFNLTSTQAVSVNRDDMPFLDRIYAEVLTTRFFLVLIGLLLIVGLTYVVPIFSAYRTLFLLSYTIVIGRSLLPTWFFMGIEKMQIMTYFNVVSRLIAYSGIFLFIHQISDFYYINLIWGIGDIVVGIYCVFFLRRRFQLITRFVLRRQIIFTQLREGWAIFLTNGLNAFYMNSGLLILSLFATERLLGLYAVAEKIMLLGKQLFGVITQATYPHACRLAAQSQATFTRFLQVEFYGCVVLFTAVGLGFFFFADPIVAVFVGQAEPQTADILRYLAFVPLIVSLNLPPYHAMVVHQFKKSYLTIIGLGALLNVIVNFALVPIYLTGGTIAAIFATELFVTVSFHVVLYRWHPRYRMQYL